MKHIILFIFIISCSTTSLAQNLVIDGSFEDTLACPLANGSTGYLANWLSRGGGGS